MINMALAEKAISCKKNYENCQAAEGWKPSPQPPG